MRMTTAAGLAALFALALSLAPPTRAQDDDENPVNGWDMIRKEFYAEREIAETKSAVIVEAPDKAEDAALVPVTIYLQADVADNMKNMRVFIDNNPMPMVGTFTFGRASGLGPKTISTRVRFDSFSYIRAIVETQDGKLHMGTHFVQAAGGCSSAAMKDVAAALESIGEMHLKRTSKPQKFASNRNQSMITAEGQVMLRHPNFSGMQRNPVTGDYIPAKYLRVLDVSRSGEPIFHLEAGISLSTNPNIRFTYGSVENETLEARAEDSDGAVFNANASPGGS